MTDQINNTAQVDANLASTQQLQAKVQKFASGTWMHLFGPGARETQCRVVIELELSKIIAAQEWTGLKYEDVQAERLTDLADSVIGANDAHDTPEDWGLELSNELPDWAKHVATASQAGMPSVVQVCLAFISEIKKSLSADQIAEIISRNKDYEDGICSSHDFCDANQCMLDAWTKLGQPMNFQAEDQMSITDQAWTLARKGEFSDTQAISIANGSQSGA